MAFNIKARALADTTVIILKDPDTEMELFADDEQTKPLTIELYGRASKQYKNHMSGIMRKLEANKRKNKQDNRSYEEMLEDSAELLSALTIKVTNFDYEGEAIVGKEMFKKLYLDPSLSWIGDQVTAALDDNGNFLQK